MRYRPSNRRRRGAHFGLITALCCLAIPASAHDGRLFPEGTWYLALDAEPFLGIADISLPGLLQLHADRTAVLVDGGDFGGLPFATRDSTQFGSWARRGRAIRVVTWFLQADASTGDVVAWQRVEMRLTQKDRDTIDGTVNVFMLSCDGPAPFPVFNCADPVDAADDFLPASPPDVPVSLRRLPARLSR